VEVVGKTSNVLLGPEEIVGEGTGAAPLVGPFRSAKGGVGSMAVVVVAALPAPASPQLLFKHGWTGTGGS
jgi:hypothetical protein